MRKHICEGYARLKGGDLDIAKIVLVLTLHRPDGTKVDFTADDTFHGQELDRCIWRNCERIVNGNIFLGTIADTIVPTYTSGMIIHQITSDLTEKFVAAYNVDDASRASFVNFEMSYRFQLCVRNVPYDEEFIDYLCKRFFGGDVECQIIQNRDEWRGYVYNEILRRKS